MALNRIKKICNPSHKTVEGKGMQRWRFTGCLQCSQQPGCLSGRAGLGGAENSCWRWYNFLFINHIASVEARS